MYLKKLELCGFKSFADRTKLAFEPGIIAIIGPNGCGKSNISDAIRWCLGEQSARSMRSQQMMDVIFGGSQSRATTGMAEVALTFDNSQNVLPIDYSEVTVTRRLFRSGESEYFINKVQCRLKDIRDLFLDTGIGAEGYAVMEQGKVEFILSSKPEERRELFEEAAGVSKFKARREETLRKLEKVDIDMNRVNDMLAMLKEQTGALDTQARKARQYKKYQEDLKRLEIASLVQKVLRANRETERIQSESDPKRQEFERLTTILDQTEADIAQLRLSQLEKDELYVRLQDEFSQVKSSINLADERIQQATNREAELRERSEVIASEIENGTAGIAQSEQELEQIRQLRQTLAEQVAGLERDYKEKEAAAQEIRNRLAECQREENALKEKIFALTTEKTNQHNEQNRLSSYRTRVQTQVISLNKELGRLQEQFKPLEEQVRAREQELTDLLARKNDILARQETLAAQVADLELRKSEVLARQTGIKERVVSLESKRQTLMEWEQKDPQRAAIHAVLGLGLPGIRGPLGGLIRTRSGAEDVIGAALGERTNYLLADTAETARQAIRHLEEHNLGRVTFVVLDRIPEAPDAQAAAGTESCPLLSMLQYEPELERVMRLLCGETFIAGKTIYGQAVVSGGTISFDKPVLIDEQLRTLDGNITLNQDVLSRVMEDGRSIQLELERVLGEKQAADLEVQKLSVEYSWNENQLRSQRDMLAYLEKEMSLNRNDIETQESEEKGIAEQLVKSEESLGRLDAGEHGLRVRYQQHEEEVQRLRDDDNRMSPLLTEAKVAWATQANELSGRDREEEKLRESLVALKDRLEQFRQESLSTENRIAEQKIVQQNESDRLKELYRDYEKKEVEIQKMLAERQEIIGALEKKTSEVHELRKQVESLDREVHHYQLEQRSFELQRQSTEQRLSEDHGLTVTEVREQYENIEVDEDEIARLKRRLESMGPVNLAAPEEYANLEERYNFLLTQQQDLIKAKEDLHQVITKINQTTRENFKVTFDRVRENFRSLYHQLFEGGEADLILTDESNLLESGVDIMAQPPGKKFQNIALLSGGEKALTAVALLFAFFMVKPSPFCILDEVDAPLDDANVGRFINMVKRFADRSQFLVITHNKRSMEMANILYGVTMEELGCSKIISVKLQKEEDVAATA